MRPSYPIIPRPAEKIRAEYTGWLTLVLVAALLCVPGVRAADSEPVQGSYNSEKPIHIQADKAVFNRKNGTSTYSGAVEVDQGRLHLRGDKMVITRGKGSDSHFTGVMTANPARLTQDAAKPGQKPLHAHAKKITFNSKTRKLHLEGKAYVKQGENIMTGKTVVYNLHTRQVTANRSKSKQVHITLYPNKSPSGLTAPGNKKEDR